MSRFIQWTCLLIAVAVFAPVAAYGELIAYDGFDYTAGNTVDGQNGGTGWATSWTANVPARAMIQDPSLISGSGNYLREWGSSGTCLVYRALDTTLTGTVYISFLAQQNNDMLRAWGLSLAYHSGTAFSVPKDNTIGQINSNFGGHPTNMDYSIQTGGMANSAYSDVPTSELQLVVASVDIGTGHMNLYLFDADGDYPTTVPGTADASITATYGLGTVNAIRLFAGGVVVGSAYADFSIDEVRIGTTWSDAVVPEPSTLALLATGLIGLLCYAWRKRK